MNAVADTGLRHVFTKVAAQKLIMVNHCLMVKNHYTIEGVLRLMLYFMLIVGGGHRKFHY